MLIIAPAMFSQGAKLGDEKRSAIEQGLKVIGHSGGQQGTSTFIMLEPERRDGVVILINMDDVDAGELATALMKVLLRVGGKGAGAAAK